MKSPPPRKYDVSDDLKLAHEHRIGRDLAITLNGKDVARVIGYDADAGKVVRMVTDAEGHYIVENNAVKVETLYGEVDVCWREPVGG